MKTMKILVVAAMMVVSAIAHAATPCPYLNGSGRGDNVKANLPSVVQTSAVTATSNAGTR